MTTSIYTTANSAIHNNSTDPESKTYRGMSVGSQPSSSLWQTKQRTASGSWSVGQWKKPAAAN